MSNEPEQEKAAELPLVPAPVELPVSEPVPAQPSAVESPAPEVGDVAPIAPEPVAAPSPPAGAVESAPAAASPSAVASPDSKQPLTKWKVSERVLLVVTAIASVAAAVFGYQSLQFYVNESRRAAPTTERVVKAVERSAAVDTSLDSARRADAEAKVREQRKAKAEEEAQERQRLEAVAQLGAEYRARLGPLVATIDSIGLGGRQNEERLHRAFRQFLEPRDKEGEGVRTLRTDELLAGISGRQDDAEVRRALMYVRGISFGRGEGFSGLSWASDTPSVLFYPPRSQTYVTKPLPEVKQALRLKRWSR